MPWISKIGVEPSMTQAEMENNAWLLYYYFTALNFTVESISGMLGNIQQESQVNPGCKQSSSTSSGWGLIQWTPSTELTAWASSRGLEWSDGYAQLRLMYEEGDGIGDTTLQWYKTSSYPYSWTQFSQLTSVDEATKAYLYNRERAGTPMLDKRLRYASEWYAVLTGSPPPPPPPPTPTRRKMPVWMMLRRL